MRTIGVDPLYQYVQWLAGKSIAGGYISPNEFNLSLTVLVPKIVRKYYGNPEDYQPAAPIPPIAYEISQVVTDYISQLRPTRMLPVTNGYFTKPGDYLHKSSCGVSWIEKDEIDDGSEDEKSTTSCDGLETVQVNTAKKKYSALKIMWVPVTFVTDGNKYAYLGSKLKQPTKRYPIAVFGDADKIYLYPNDIKTVLFTYIRYPKPGKWAASYATGAPIYDATNSENIELPDICADELAVTILDRVGISIREAGLVNWSRYIKETGK